MESARVDRDREVTDDDVTSVTGVRPTAGGRDTRTTLGKTQEVGGGTRSLESNEVGPQQSFDEFLTPRQATVELNRRERDVEEEPDTQIGTHLTQVRGNEVELVILHPHRGPFGGLLGGLLGEPLVDLLEGVPPLAVEHRLDHAVVIQRPQGGVGESLVVLLDLLGAERHRVDVVAIMVEGLDDLVRGAVPPDPCTTLALHDRLECRHQTTRGGLPADVSFIVDLPVHGQAICDDKEVNLVLDGLRHVSSHLSWRSCHAAGPPSRYQPVVRVRADPPYSRAEVPPWDRYV